MVFGNKINNLKNSYKINRQLKLKKIVFRGLGKYVLFFCNSWKVLPLRIIEDSILLKSLSILIYL